MPNIATVFKAEIARIARKESRTELEALKSSSSRYRSEIAALKRRCQVLEAQLRGLSTRAPKQKPVQSGAEESPPMRWRPDGLKKFRVNMGLSAADLAKVIGCSAQAVYKWEEGSVRPQRAQLAAITAVKALSKKQVEAKLAEKS